MTEVVVDPIVAAPSVENGNVPVETEPAPSEQPTTEKPAEPVVTEEPAVPKTDEPKEELFELPDGRKVDAATLTKEWKENFLPDYTRKSQELAAKKEPSTPVTNETPQNPLADPNYVPQSYEELVQQIEQRMEARQVAKVQEAEERAKAVEDHVSAQLTEIKAIDATLNENALFQHAIKYQFRDLKAAHQNMKDMAEMAKKVQNTTVQNIVKRNDPVSTTHGANAGATVPDRSQFATATDYLRSLKS